MLKENESLISLLGDTDTLREEWIPTPTLYSAFNNPLMNDAGEIINSRAGLVYSGQQHATKYEIYRDELENITLSNDNWDVALKIDEVTELNENGFVKLTYEDFSVVEGKTYVYRVRVYDDTHDPDYTFSGSLQSKIYDDINPISYIFDINENNSSKLTVSLDDEFNVEGRVILFSASGTNDNVYRVIKKQEFESNKSIWITPQLQVQEDGEIYHFKCVATIS